MAGTAIYKAAATKAECPSNEAFVYAGIDPGDGVAGDAYLRIAGEYARTAHNRTSSKYNNVVSTGSCQVTVGESLALTTTGACPTATTSSSIEWISVSIRRLPDTDESNSSNPKSRSSVVNEAHPTEFVVECNLRNPGNTSLVISIEVKSNVWGIKFDEDGLGLMRIPSLTATTTTTVKHGRGYGNDGDAAGGVNKSQFDRDVSLANLPSSVSSTSPLPSLGLSMLGRVSLFSLPPRSTTVVVADLA